MVMRLVANGPRIKELRTGARTELPQKMLAGQCGISERQLRRMENENVATKLPVLERLAKELSVAVDDISFGLRGPQRVSDEKVSALAAPPIGSQKLSISHSYNDLTCADRRRAGAVRGGKGQHGNRAARAGRCCPGADGDD
jgi:hypothetical protein